MFPRPTLTHSRVNTSMKMIGSGRPLPSTNMLASRPYWNHDRLMELPEIEREDILAQRLEEMHPGSDDYSSRQQHEVGKACG